MHLGVLTRAAFVRAAFPQTVTWILVAICCVLGCQTTGGAAAEDAGLSTDAAQPTCAAGYVGDPDKPMVIELRALDTEGRDVALQSGNDLALIEPPQGGRVSFVGVRAQNLDTCGAQITGVVRDLGSKQIRVDGRTVNLRADGEGWATTGHGTVANLADSAILGDYANIPLCPNQWAETDIFDHTFELELRILDRQKKTGSVIIQVAPRCSEAGSRGAACKCMCARGYVLGATCGTDAGTGTEGGT